ncbi:G2/mitotic-specific cyclin C13-1-like protein [Tanacetum coccineum]
MDNKFGKYVFKFWSLKEGVGSNRTSDICYFLSNNVVAHKTAKGVSKKAVTKDVNTQKIADEVSDPQMCETYVEDIYDYLHDMEVKRIPLPDYIEKVEKDVSVNMRGVLVDWLVEVSEEYNHLPESLYLTISYIDRYLSLNVLNRQNFSFLVFLQCSLHHTQYAVGVLKLLFSGIMLVRKQLRQVSASASVTFLARFILKPKSHPWNADLVYALKRLIGTFETNEKTKTLQEGTNGFTDNGYVDEVSLSSWIKPFMGDVEGSTAVISSGSVVTCVRDALSTSDPFYQHEFLYQRNANVSMNSTVLCAYMESDELFHSELREALTSLKKVIMYEALLSFFVTDIPLLSYEVDSFVMFLLKSERSWRLNRVFIVMLQHSHTSPLNIEISGFVTFTAELDYVNLL